jgi:hypothetical protein
MVFLLKTAHAKQLRRIDVGLRPGPTLARLGSRQVRREMRFHRWFDVGDLQSVDLLKRICEVARATPEIWHWLETKELGFVRDFVAQGGRIPRNLVIRASAIDVDDVHPRRNWPWTSSVYTEDPPRGSFLCEAWKRGNRCGGCRACWDRSVKHVAYLKHF